MARAMRALIRHGVRRGLPSRSGFSRRDFLRTGARLTGAAAAASMLPAGSGCSVFNKQPQPGKGKKVAIIGAGFAGLTCADVLRDAGAEVVVFEAADRPGGRVFSDRQFIPGKSVELGGELIGENHPTWWQYAKKFHLLKDLDPLEEYEGDTALILDGKLVPSDEADKLYEEVDTATAHLIKAAEPIDPVRPWKSPGAADLDRTSFKEAVSRFGLGDRARELLIVDQEADQGVAADRMSMLCLLALIKAHGLADYWTKTETHRLSGGNDRLATAMAKSLGGRVRFRTTVVAIERRNDGVTIKTNDGGSHDADAVVLAIPPSVWDSVAITPKLDEKIRPQMGSNVKLILSLRQPVWEQHNRSPELESDGMANLTWVSADRGSGGPIGFTLFSGAGDSEDFRKVDPKNRARQGIASVAPAYPGLSDAVLKDRFMDWPSMPRAKASYSFAAPGEITTFGEAIVDGITADGLAPLHFAGEHTSYGFIGYMEGALSSGVRVARQILASKAAEA